MWSCVLAGMGALVFAGCDGRQSALKPAGRAAEEIAGLFWGLTIGAVVIWLGVVALTIYAIRARGAPHAGGWNTMLIIGGGALVPTIVLAALLIYGLGLMPPMLARAPEGSLRILVTGEQYWWRVKYLLPGGETVESANEIRLPVGETVEFELASPDVIHSFWIPALGGKMDMIPGRRTRLALEPTRTGVFRGVCAEYCGTSHALMAFDVVVMAKAEFAQWLEAQRRPAEPAADPRTQLGRERFFANGCSACHTIAGTEARGVVGPDLSHVGSRLSLGAGIIANDANGLRRWLEQTDQVKPGVLMPHFRMLPREEIDALVAYLESLR